MDDSLDKKHIRFRNAPKPFAKADYDTAIRCIVSKMSGCRDVVAIYQFGNISSPGISDIDVVFVLSDNPSNIGEFKRVLTQCKQEYGYFIDPFVIPRSLFRDINTIFPVFIMKRLYGDEISVKRNTDIKNLYKAILIDTINFYWPREYLRLIFEKKSHLKKQNVSAFFYLRGKVSYIDIRNLLCRLNSLKYPVKILSFLTGKKYNDLDVTISEVQKLRSEWFTSGCNYETLYKLLMGAVPFTLKFIEHAKMYLESQRDFDISELPDIRFDYDYGIIEFVRNWSFEFALRESVRLSKKRKRATSVLPLVFAPNVLCYRGDCCYIKNDAYRNTLMHRYELIRKHTEFLNRYSIYCGDFTRFNYPFRGPFLYKLYLTFHRVLRKTIF